MLKSRLNLFFIFLLGLGVSLGCGDTSAENGGDEHASVLISASANIRAEIVDVELNDFLENYEEGMESPSERATVKLLEVSDIDNPQDIELPSMAVDEEVLMEFMYSLRNARVEIVFDEAQVVEDRSACLVSGSFFLDEGQPVYQQSTCNEERAGVTNLPGLADGDVFSASVTICPSCPHDGVFPGLFVYLYEKQE